MIAHPFPPVVRWALFPALAGLAGGVGGALGASLGGLGMDVWPVVMTGALSMGAALASMLTMYAWPCLLAAPAFGLFVLVTGLACMDTVESGDPPNPRRIINHMMNELSVPLLFGTVDLLQAAVHRLALRRSWPIVLGSGIAVATLSFALGLLLPPQLWNFAVAGLLSASTLAQVPAVLAARGVARRLRPPEAA
ncbi:MAG TPA: hypothetical protein VF950_29010 [Planctomycetota bacterium]